MMTKKEAIDAILRGYKVLRWFEWDETASMLSRVADWVSCLPDDADPTQADVDPVDPRTTLDFWRGFMSLDKPSK